MMQLGIFDLNDRLDQLSKIGDPLEVLNEKIDWSSFDDILNQAQIRDVVQRGVHN